MGIVRAFVCKDVRRFWPLFSGVLIVLFVFFAYQPQFRSREYRLVFQFFPILAWGAWGLLIACIIHDAPPPGSSEFWMTRPVSGTQLFAAKLAVIVLLCVFAPVLELATAKIPGLTWNDWQAVIFMFARLPAVALGLAALASVTRNAPQYVLGIFGAWFGFAPYTLYSVQTKPRAPRALVMPYRDALEWTLLAAFITGMIFIIHRQYTRRNRLATLGACALPGVLLFGIWNLWPTVPRV
jgi:hypothetical protein